MGTARSGRTRSIAAAVALVALIAAACSDADAVTTTVAPTTTSTTAAPTTTTSTTTSTTTTTTTIAPTTTATSDEVGDASAMHAQVVELLEILKRTGGVEEGAEPYLPDVSNPDPVVALEELWKFENWMISTLPSADWVPMYVYPDSPYDREASRFLNTWQLSGFRYVDFSDTYYFQNAQVIDLADSGLPDDILSSVPAGSATIVYESGSGEASRINVDTGEVIQVDPPWGPTPSLAIVSPTSTGWKLFFSEFDYVP